MSSLTQFIVYVNRLNGVWHGLATDTLTHIHTHWLSLQLEKRSFVRYTIW